MVRNSVIARYLIFIASVPCSSLVHDGENVKRLVAEAPSDELDTNSTKHVIHNNIDQHSNNTGQSELLSSPMFDPS
jgi:hypothetical protein